MKNQTPTGSLTFLGTGGSMGTPVIGCSCLACTSLNPKDQRLRSSLLIEWEGKKWVIDPGPDFRQQALKYGITDLEGIFITHAHQDHIGGIDELRVYNFFKDKKIEALLSEETYADLVKRFYYIFKEHSSKLISKVNCVLLKGDKGSFSFGPFQGKFFSYYQSGMKVTGFRLKDLAYVTDIKEIPSRFYEEVKGVKVLVLSCLRKLPSDMHLSLEEAVAIAKKVNAPLTYFIHISHEMSVESVEKELPSSIELAYDGLHISGLQF